MSIQSYFKQFSLTWVHNLALFDPIRCYHSGPEWTWERWQWSGTPYSPKLQHYWSLTIILFSVISRTLVRVGLPLCSDTLSVFYNPSRMGNQKECGEVNCNVAEKNLMFAVFLENMLIIDKTRSNTYSERSNCDGGFRTWQEVSAMWTDNTGILFWVSKSRGNDCLTWFEQ